MTAAIELRPDERRLSDQGHAAIGRKPGKRNPGGYEIFVDGKLWGRTYGEPRGVHGVTYYIHQAGVRGGEHRAFVMKKRAVDVGERAYDFGESSDKMYLWSLPPNTKPIPLLDRLTAKVREAIDAGALCDPDVLAERAAADAVKRREAEEARTREEFAQWQNVIDEVVGDLRFELPENRLGALRGPNYARNELGKNAMSGILIFFIFVLAIFLLVKMQD